MNISDFERERLANIQRNQNLLKQLNLDAARDAVKQSIPSNPAAPKRRVTRAPTIKREVSAPTRRSRRIAGSKIEQEDPVEFQRQLAEQQEKDRKQQELERLRLTRLFGDFSLMDLIIDSRLGSLKYESKVNANLRQSFQEHNKNNVNHKKSMDETPRKRPKLRSENDNVKKEPEEELDQSLHKPDVHDERASRVLEVIRSLGDKFSTGDLYSEIKASSLDSPSLEILRKRQELEELKIYPSYDPLDLKLTHTRITALALHPAVDDRIVVGGDTSGHVGIWAVDETLPDTSASVPNDNMPAPSITILKPHGRSISKILAPLNDPAKLYTASYDGSVRVLDLVKLSSSESAYLRDPWETSDTPLGISDMNMCTDLPSVMYMTTLSGNFIQHDVRQPFKAATAESLLRVHDKKIGGFAINPNALHQIATASLDRTLKIWDLRNVTKSNARWLEFEDQIAPHMYGGFTSRLSISCVDWNRENRLVCNGYDDKINIVDLSASKQYPCVAEWDAKFVPDKKLVTEESVTNIKSSVTIRHNCQTGRWVSILKLRWQENPQDGIQKFVIANMNRGLDVYDQNGQALAHLTEQVGAVPAVCAFHPTQNWLAGGLASSKVYLFT